MAAPKARDILRLNRDDDGNVHSVIIRDTDGSERTHYVDRLPRVELMRVVAQVWPGKRDWRRYGNDAIVMAITDGLLPDVIEAGTAEPVHTSTVSNQAWQATEPVTQAATPATQTTPATPAEPVDTGDSDPLAKALRQAMRSIASDTVNETQVRNIVKSETESLIAEAVSQVARPVITMIQVNDSEPVQVAGRTHKQFEQVLTAMSAGENLMLIGPPATGKTFMAEQAADALGLPFYSAQCHAQMPASQIFGYMDASGNYVSTLFRKAFETGGVFLWDEVDNGNTNILASVNAALANGTCAFPDSMVKKSQEVPFMVVAAANTFGTGPDAMYSGRNALDSAFLDRFTRLTVDYDDELEAEIATAINPAQAADWVATVRRYRERAQAHNLRVIISPRATYSGLNLLKAGWAKKDVVEARILAGLTPDQRAKLAG